jgi:enamidase
MSESLLIKNISRIVTGLLSDPFIESNAIAIKNAVIDKIGDLSEFSEADFEVVIDANGCTVIPGLIDSHLHNVIGDYTPRQKTVDFLESYVHGGITTGISASEVHAPGRPTDPVGVKALAIAAQRCFANYRPGGMRVYSGSVILEPELTEQDFIELKNAGVWLAKAGMGNFKPPREVAPIVRVAQKHGFKVMLHTGGASIPGSSAVTADDVLEIQPDVVGHVNGGPTALSESDLDRVLDGARGYFQIVQAGNLRCSLKIANVLKERGALNRLLIASDTPTGTGMMPLAVIKSIAELSSVGPLAPHEAIAAATGNVSSAYGIPEGVIQAGRPADLVIIDTPLGSAFGDALSAIAGGDIPGIGAVITAGELRFIRSRNTPPATRMPKLAK